MSDPCQHHVVGPAVLCHFNVFFFVTEEKKEELRFLREIFEFMKLFLSGKTKFTNHLSVVSAQFATSAVPLVEF